jgi:DNA-binding NarL/FixJ family response regulator
VGHPLTKRILIADDHESVLRGVRAMLEAHPGWEVCGEAVNGYEALTKAIELRPDLIILDFAMPKVDGLKAADEISKLLPGVRIVLHTIYGAGVVLEANRHGIFRVVEKAKSGALVSAIEELLNANVEQTSGPDFTARSGGDTTN